MVTKLDNNERAIVYLFKGSDNYDGISYESFKSLEKIITNLFPKFTIYYWNNIDVQPEKWHQKAICIFPGGECGKWQKILSKKRQKKIFQWLKNGGKIIGICAGAYFCSKKSIYSVNPYQQIKVERIIQPFQGICQGPFLSHKIEIVKVKWEKTQEEGYVTLIKGGSFIQNQSNIQNQSTNDEILARFSVNNAIATIKCKTDQGISILSSVHWEFEVQDVKPFVLDANLLENSQEFRKNCMIEMIKSIV